MKTVEMMLSPSHLLNCSGLRQQQLDPPQEVQNMLPSRQEPQQQLLPYSLHSLVEQQKYEEQPEYELCLHVTLLDTMPRIIALKTSPTEAAKTNLKQHDFHIKSLAGGVCIRYLYIHQAKYQIQYQLCQIFHHAQEATLISSPMRAPFFSLIITVSMRSSLSLQQLMAIILPRKLKLALQTGPMKFLVSFISRALPLILQMLTKPSSEQVMIFFSVQSRQVGRHCTSLMGFWWARSRYSSESTPLFHFHTFTQQSEEPEMRREGSSWLFILFMWAKLSMIHLFFSQDRMLCSQARQFTAYSWAQTEKISSNFSLNRVTEPSDSPTANKSSVSEGQKARDKGRQSTFLQMISVMDDLPHRQRSISRLMEALAKQPKMGRLHAILRMAALFFSTPRLRSLEQRGSLFCSSPSAEQKKISPLELETASMLPWQLYCWSRITPSCLQVQWKRGRTVSSLINISITRLGALVK